MKDKQRVPCPCGSTLTLQECCGALLEGACSAPTAERLMRSRYTAFVFHRRDYLLATWHPATRPAALEFDVKTPIKWVSLTVLRVEGGREQDAEGVVEFVARFKVHGKAEKLHEISRFAREQQCWRYLAGDMLP